MRPLLSRILKYFLERINRRLLTGEQLKALKDEIQCMSRELHLAYVGAETAIAMSGGKPEILPNLPKSSRSERGQDVFAYLASGQKSGGYFVEFGAGDGVAFSNSVMLERELGWTGILAEPLVEYHAAIRQQRSATLDTRCVWRSSADMVDFVGAGYLSTIDQFRDSDHHASSRASGQSTPIETVSLWDLLEQNGAPTVIDFLSIDTEGSEYEILRAFPFGERYLITAIACEHNFTRNREAVCELLLSAGYMRVTPDLSAHDDWFVLSRATGRGIGSA